MEELLKRIKSAGWVALAGFIATAITLTIEYIDVFNLTAQQQALAVIFGTAIVSQITKWLNTR